MPVLQAIIFDLYGTLVHLTEEKHPYSRLFADLFADLNLRTPEEFREARKTVLTEDFKSLTDLVNRIKPGAFLDLESYEQKVAASVTSVMAYPETREVLTELRKRKFKLGLISNLASPYKEPFFRLGLHEFFNTVVFSCEVGLAKPDFGIYEKALRDLGLVPSQAMMIGNKVHCDVDPPKVLGMEALLIDRENTYTGSYQKITNLKQALTYLN